MPGGRDLTRRPERSRTSAVPRPCRRPAARNRTRRRCTSCTTVSGCRTPGEPSCTWASSSVCCCRRPRRFPGIGPGRCRARRAGTAGRRSIVCARGRPVSDCPPRARAHAMFVAEPQQTDTAGRGPAGLDPVVGGGRRKLQLALELLAECPHGRGVVDGGRVLELSPGHSRRFLTASGSPTISVRRQRAGRTSRRASSPVPRWGPSPSRRKGGPMSRGDL